MYPPWGAYMPNGSPGFRKAPVGPWSPWRTIWPLSEASLFFPRQLVQRHSRISSSSWFCWEWLIRRPKNCCLPSLEVWMASRITSSSGTWLIGVLLTESMGDFHTKKMDHAFWCPKPMFFFTGRYLSTWWLLPVEVQVGTVSSPQFGLDLWCILLGQKLHAQEKSAICRGMFCPGIVPGLWVPGCRDIFQDVSKTSQVSRTSRWNDTFRYFTSSSRNIRPLNCFSGHILRGSSLIKKDRP